MKIESESLASLQTARMTSVISILERHRTARGVRLTGAGRPAREVGGAQEHVVARGGAVARGGRRQQLGGAPGPRRRRRLPPALVLLRHADCARIFLHQYDNINIYITQIQSNSQI